MHRHRGAQGGRLRAGLQRLAVKPVLVKPGPQREAGNTRRTPGMAKIAAGLSGYACGTAAIDTRVPGGRPSRWAASPPFTAMETSPALSA